MRSCSASGAAAGSPAPPYARQVARENWYLPRYRPLGETAAGLPDDSHWAILSSAVEAPEDGRDALLDPASPRDLRVTGRAMPSPARRGRRWWARTARRVAGP